MTTTEIPDLTTPQRKNLLLMGQLLAKYDYRNGIVPIAFEGGPGVDARSANALVRYGLATRHTAPVDGYKLTGEGRRVLAAMR